MRPRCVKSICSPILSLHKKLLIKIKVKKHVITPPKAYCINYFSDP